MSFVSYQVYGISKHAGVRDHVLGHRSGLCGEPASVCEGRADETVKSILPRAPHYDTSSA